jgi:hypothetical protein
MLILRNGDYTKRAKKENTPLALSVNGSAIGSTSVYFGEHSSSGIISLRPEPANTSNTGRLY